jgi:hypothetical protein
VYYCHNDIADGEAIFIIGASSYFLNGKVVKAEAPAYIENGHTP